MKWSAFVVGLCLLLAVPGILSAEIWRCPQESGTDLFTNDPPDPSKCDQYVRSTTVSPDPEPTVAGPPDTLGQSPIILFPYAQDGPAAPDPFINPPLDSFFPYSYYPFESYPSYYGFFGYTRPHFRFSPGIRRHFGSRHQSHMGIGGRHHSRSGARSHSGTHARSGRR